MRGIVVAALALLVWVAPAQAGMLAERCGQTDARLAGACRGAEVFAAQGSAVCRKAGTQTEAACATPLNPPVTRAAVDAYEGSWVHGALASQYSLGSSVTFIDAPWVGTHNSFNSASELPTLSQTDAKQQHSLTDQLRMDVRSLELDVHWFPSAYAGGARAPVLCHARGADEFHAGCTVERLLEDGLLEIRAWLDAHRDQVVLLYIEDHLVEPAAFDAAAAALQRTFPANPDCAGNQGRFQRYYEDSTGLSASAPPPAPSRSSSTPDAPAARPGRGVTDLRFPVEP